MSTHSGNISRAVLGTPQAFLLLAVVCAFVGAANIGKGNLLARSDFPAFYNAGLILREYGRDRLYDKELQRKLDGQVVANRGERNELLFAYTPFFAVLFYPLSILPINVAFAVWSLISVALFCAGFLLAWRAAGLPDENRLGALLISLSFLPFVSYCLLAGQSSGFGFFFLALAVYLEVKKRLGLSGVVLSLLLYKPTLLPLMMLMVVITQRWRVLAGFCVGALALGSISLLLVGFRGAQAYVDMLHYFSESKAAGKHPLWLDVDIYSSFLALIGGPAANWLALTLTALAVPFIILAWRRRPLEAWGLNTLWTLVLSPYVVIYDATFAVLAVVLTAGWRLPIPVTLRILITLLYVTPWVTRQMAKTYNFQVLTVALISFGIYQLYFLLRKPTHVAAA